MEYTDEPGVEVSPAHAGMDRKMLPVAFGVTSEPRARGDGPVTSNPMVPMRT